MPVIGKSQKLSPLDWPDLILQVAPSGFKFLINRDFRSGAEGVCDGSFSVTAAEFVRRKGGFHGGFAGGAAQ